MNAGMMFSEAQSTAGGTKNRATRQTVSHTRLLMNWGTVHSTSPLDQFVPLFHPLGPPKNHPEIPEPASSADLFLLRKTSVPIR